MIISSKAGTRVASSLLLNTGLEVLARTIRQEKCMKMIKKEMRSNYLSFEDGVILYLKDPKDSIRKLTDLINTSSHVAREKKHLL